MWVGGAGGARLSRGAPGTLTVYCSQARCPLYLAIGCVLTSRGVAGTRVPRRGCLFPAHGRYAWVRRARRRTAARWVEVAVG